MAWMKRDPVEPALSSELDDALKSLRSKAMGCPDPKLIQAAQADVLDAAQTDQINRHLQHCGLCKSVLADLEYLDNLELSRAGKARIWNKVRSATGAQEALGKTYSLWMRPMVLAGAMAALVVVLVGVFLARPSPGTRNAEKQPSPAAIAQPSVFALEKPPVVLPASGGIIWRGQQDPADKAVKDLKNALIPYQANDYREAGKRLQLLRKKYPRMPEAAFYLGVSQLFLNQNDEAAKTLKDAVDLSASSLNETATWYLALADYRAGRREVANELLQKSCRVTGKDSARACAGAKELADQH